MRRITFEETHEFYDRVKSSIERGEAISIETEFSSPDDVPARLREALGGRKAVEALHKISAIENNVRHLKVDAHESYELDRVLLTAAIGAAIGVWLGGPFGAAVGGVLGATVGYVSKMGTNDATVKFVVDKSGKLTIEISGKKG